MSDRLYFPVPDECDDMQPDNSLHRSPFVPIRPGSFHRFGNVQPTDRDTLFRSPNSP